MAFASLPFSLRFTYLELIWLAKLVHLGNQLQSMFKVNVFVHRTVRNQQPVGSGKKLLNVLKTGQANRQASKWFSTIQTYLFILLCVLFSVLNAMLCIILLVEHQCYVFCYSLLLSGGKKRKTARCQSTYSSGSLKAFFRIELPSYPRGFSYGRFMYRSVYALSYKPQSVTGAPAIAT